VSTERPLAAVQIGIAIAALEVLGASIQKYTEPGDLKFDPFGIKPEDPEELAAVQLKELKVCLYLRLCLCLCCGWVGECRACAFGPPPPPHAQRHPD